MRTALRRRLAAAALAAAALAGSPAPAGAQDGDWVRYRSDSETVEVEVPPSFKPVEIKNPNVVLHLLSSGLPYQSSYVKAYAHPGQNNLESYLKFVIKDTGGTSPAMVEGSTTRFTCEKAGGDGTTWIMLGEARIEGGKCGYYVVFGVPKTILEEHKDDYDRMVASFVTKPPPEDAFTVPPGWEKKQTDYYAILGQRRDLPEEVWKQVENRLYLLISWLHPQAPDVRMVREWTGDKRKQVARSVIHVLPTREKFQAAAGDFYREGASAIYLPQHAERIVVVDGSPDSGLNEHELCGALAVQAFETRMPPLRPWLREALRQYFEHASHRKAMPGLYPPEVLKRAKAMLAGKPPATFEEVLAKDEAGLRALGEPGAFACWCYFYYGLHGAEGPLRDLFRRFKEGLLGAADCQAVWDKEVASYKSVAKKPFKPRDVEEGAKKYFKGLKE